MVDTIRPPVSRPSLESLPNDSTPPGPLQEIPPPVRTPGDVLIKSDQDVERAPSLMSPPSLTDKPELPPPEPNLDVASALASIRGKVSEIMQQVCKTGIEQKQETHAALMKERVEHIQKSADAMKNADAWGIVGKVLGWVVPALTLAAGVAITVASFWTGVGAAVGASLIVGGLMGLAMQTLQETGAMDHINNWVADVYKSMGIPEETAKWLAFATVTVATCVIMVGASLGAGMVGGWIGAGTRVAQSAGQAAAQVAAKASADYALKIGTAVVQGGVNLGTQSVKIPKCIYESSAMFSKADAQSVHARIKNMQQKLEDQAEKLKEVEEAYHKGIEIIMGVIRAQDKGARMALQV